MMQNCSGGDCYVDENYRKILNEINSLIDSERFFEIHCSNIKGKHIHSKIDIQKNTNFLIEVPFISWPIKLLYNFPDKIVFCENCLKIRNKNNFDDFLTIDELNLNKRICSTYCLKKAFGRCLTSGNTPNSLNNGWAVYLQGLNGIQILRKYQDSVDPEGKIPITAEAISRLIAQTAADIHSFWMELGRDKETLHVAFKLGCKSIENFISPPETLFPEINFKSLTSCIKSVLFKPLKDIFLDEEVPNILLSEKTIKQLLGQLTLNSQGINIFGFFYNSTDNKQNVDELELDSYNIVMKGACMCTIQSCFNHSCDPNCYVYSIEDNTIYVSTTRDIKKGEELTISYVDNSLPFLERTELISNYHFKCNCKICLAQEKSLNIRYSLID